VPKATSHARLHELSASHSHLHVPLAALLGFALLACGDVPTAAQTLDLGDNFEAPDRRLDEDLYHCVIQPQIVGPQRCAGGRDSDSGGCHTERSALRLVVVPDEPRCDGDILLGAPPLESQANLDRVRASVGIDAEASPFYRRPVGLDSHPRMIFDEGSVDAELIRDWINTGNGG